jgi:hypothetical protein
MRICFMMAAVFALTSAALAEAPDRPTAILVSPIHEAQIVRANDGMSPAHALKLGVIPACPDLLLSLPVFPHRLVVLRFSRADALLAIPIFAHRLVVLAFRDEDTRAMRLADFR